jgi:tRNA A37 N6-isopentenylltransferase MiaA
MASVVLTWISFQKRHVPCIQWVVRAQILMNLVTNRSQVMLLVCANVNQDTANKVLQNHAYRPGQSLETHIQMTSLQHQSQNIYLMYQVMKYCIICCKYGLLFCFYHCMQKSMKNYS